MNVNLPDISIGPHRIGQSRPVFVIAEAGVNHNGNVDLALELVRAAKRAGADCVKFQTFKAERVATAGAPKAPYQQRLTPTNETQLGMLKKLELSTAGFAAAKQLCDSEGLVFLSTPYSPEDVDILEELHVPAYKIASGQLVEPGFLRYVAARQKPVLLSTGMATLAEVDLAVRQLRESGQRDLILLQCTTNYPSAVSDAHLRVIPVFRDAFDVLVGYSDHVESVAAVLAAVALGAVVVEKHLTLDRTMEGPDHAASLNPTEFGEMVKLIRDAEAALGSGLKAPTPSELANLGAMRRSIAAGRDLAAGTILDASMLVARRPATGIPCARLDELIGTTLRRPLAEGQLVQWSDVDR